MRHVWPLCMYSYCVVSFFPTERVDGDDDADDDHADDDDGDDDD